MSALFDGSARSHVRDTALSPFADKPLALPYELRNQMKWIDFSYAGNPLGTPKSFIQAMHSALVDGELGYPPDRNAHAFRSVLAYHYGLPPASFHCGSSASELVHAVAQTYLPCRVGVVSPAPIENFQAVTNAGHEAIQIKMPRAFSYPDALMARDLGVLFDAVVLANPTFPTSRLLTQSTLETYLEACSWVVVDETYIELTLGGESMIPLTQQHKNLIVVSSMSATYAMPGVPISYCVSHPDTIQQIDRFFDNSGLSMFAEVLGALIEPGKDYLESTRDFLETEIPWMQCMLNLVPGISILPAEANYVMCSFENSDDMALGVADTEELVLRLQLAGFLVRKLDDMPGIDSPRYFCVAIRSRDDNDKLLRALRDIISCRL